MGWGSFAAINMCLSHRELLKTNSLSARDAARSLSTHPLSSPVPAGGAAPPAPPGAVSERCSGEGHGARAEQRKGQQLSAQREGRVFRGDREH